MSRLLALTDEQVRHFHDAARTGHAIRLPGTVRVSANRATTSDDIAALGDALRAIADTPDAARRYRLDKRGGYTLKP